MDIVVAGWFGLLVMVTAICSSKSTLPLPQSLSTRCGGDSSKTFDICGVCGGDGSSCRGQGQDRVQGDSPRSRRSKFLWRQVWTPCSVTCGVGQRRREALCVNTQRNRTVKVHRCRRKPRPYVAVTSCLLSPCPHDWQSDDSFVLSQSPKDDLFSKHFGDLFSDQIPSLPKFFTEEWSACSVTCGKGTRSREVTCKLLNTFTKREEVLSDWECFGKKPDSLEICDVGPCRSDLPSTMNAVEGGEPIYRWHAGQFSACSRSCLGGTQESQVRCVEKGKETDEVSPSLCAGQRKPPVVVRSCNAVPCPPSWDIGDYGACSKQCGGGVMRRRVRCVQREADDSLTPVEDFRCPDPVPIAEISCNNVYCPAEWSSGPWEQCSETCGIGVQNRRVSCVKEPVAGHRVTVSNTFCLGPRPDASRSCSIRDCPDVDAPPVIKAENYTFIQLRRAKKVRLNVGGKVVLLPGQSVTIRCPVKNYHRRLIFWSKRLKLIPMVGRVRASFNGHLKIRKGNPVSDTGTYTCMAGSESADVRIEFLTRQQALQKMKNINQYLRKDSSRASVIVRPGEPRYQDGAFQDGGYNLTNKFVYMADEWSPCSVTCGSGHQKRQVTCTRVTKKYMKILPERECEKVGLKKTVDIRKCSPHSECPHWIAGNWSTCSLMTCVRDGYAERRRKLHCAYSDGTSAPSQSCQQKRRPETVRLCVNIDCISHWTTSNWTPCRPSCGEQGVKMRMLTCSWKKTGLPAWTACKIHSRPNVRKVCKIRPCPRSALADCEDSSRYCSLARMLRMCRYNDFRRSCCKSCTEFLQSTLS